MRFESEQKALRRALYLTIAAGASSEFLDHTEMRKVQQYVDTVNLMSYNYYKPGAIRSPAITLRSTLIPPIRRLCLKQLRRASSCRPRRSRRQAAHLGAVLGMSRPGALRPGASLKPIRSLPTPQTGVRG